MPSARRERPHNDEQGGALGATDKVVQRILRHAKPHVTRERYIKAFDPAVLAAMKQMEAAFDVVSKRLPPAYQVN